MSDTPLSSNPLLEARAAFVKIIREENADRAPGCKWSLAQHWNGALSGFADHMLQSRWLDFQRGWNARTTDEPVEGIDPDATVLAMRAGSLFDRKDLSLAEREAEVAKLFSRYKLAQLTPAASPWKTFAEAVPEQGRRVWWSQDGDDPTMHNGYDFCEQDRGEWCYVVPPLRTSEPPPDTRDMWICQALPLIEAIADHERANGTACALVGWEREKIANMVERWALTHNARGMVEAVKGSAVTKDAAQPMHGGALVAPGRCDNGECWCHGGISVEKEATPNSYCPHTNDHKHRSYDDQPGCYYCGAELRAAVETSGDRNGR